MLLVSTLLLGAACNGGSSRGGNVAGLLDPAFGVTITPDLPSPQLQGTVVTFTGTGIGAGPFDFQFSLMGPSTGGTLTVQQVYGGGATWAWDTTGVTGVHTVRVDVRFAGTASVSDAFASLMYSIVLSTQPCTVLARVSVDSAGAQGNDESEGPSLSTDGQFVAFQSEASNLVAGDTNDEDDVFVHDRTTGVTERVSVDSAGAQGNDESEAPSIGADGRFVAFESTASNLVAGDTNGVQDVFVHDRTTGVTERVSVDSLGAQGNDTSNRPSISADGRFVAFQSDATNLVAADTNGRQDVFVHDRVTGMTVRVSVDSAGVAGNRDSSAPSLSADGLFVAFESKATNLAAGDTNGRQDVFVHDRTTGVTERISDGSDAPSISADGRFVAFELRPSATVSSDPSARRDVFVHDRTTGVTVRVSVDSAGAAGDRDSSAPSISADGRFVAFESTATNLVAGDTNAQRDVFVHDRTIGMTVRVSVDAVDAQGNDESEAPSISADGRFVAFESEASNLVAADTNDEEDVFVAGNCLLP